MIPNLRFVQKSEQLGCVKQPMSALWTLTGLCIDWLYDLFSVLSDRSASGSISQIAYRFTFAIEFYVGALRSCILSKMVITFLEKNCYQSKMNVV